MASSGQRIRHHPEQRLARQFSKRASLLQRDTATSSVPSTVILSSDAAATPAPSTESTTALSAAPSSSSGPPGITLPPHGVAALVGIIVMLSVFVLSFAAWRVWVYQRNKKEARAASSVGSEKPVGLFDAVHDVHIKRTLSAEEAAVVFPPKAGEKVTMTRERTAAEVKVNLRYQPKVIYAGPEENTILVSKPLAGKPPGSKRPGITVTPPPGLQISPPPVYVAVPAPVLSPRTGASKAPRTSVLSNASKPANGSKLPRLVVVESTFTPSLHDELPIREGETLRLLEEYEDEWCLVQRVGPNATEKGVVPRFCVVDNPISHR